MYGMKWESDPVFPPLHRSFAPKQKEGKPCGVNPYSKLCTCTCSGYIEINFGEIKYLGTLLAYHAEFMILNHLIFQYLVSCIF